MQAILRAHRFLANAMTGAGHDAEVWAVSQPAFQAILAGAEESASLPSIVHSPAGDIGLEGHDGRLVLDNLFSVQVRGSLEQVCEILDEIQFLAGMSGGDFSFEHETGGEALQAVDFYWQIVTLRVAPHGFAVPERRVERTRILFGPDADQTRLLWGPDGDPTEIQW